MLIKKVPEDFIVEEIPSFDIKEFGEYRIYELAKRNMNTETAVEIICKKFGILRKNIKYAGTKDKNALTKQYISIKNLVKNSTKNPSKNSAKSSTVGIEGEVIREIKINNDLQLTFKGFSNDPLSLGTLIGNKFEIIVREISVQEMENFSSRKHFEKIPNYYDEQRFSKDNFDIGLCILKGDFKKASNILAQSTRDERFHESIHNNPNDFIGAIRRIPQKILSMYIHSVQSYIFNECLSRTLTTHLKDNERYFVEYSLGKLMFPTYEKMSNLRQFDFKQFDMKQIPLVGFDYDGSNIEINNIMNELDLKNTNFIIRQIPELSKDASLREAFVAIQNFSSEITDDKTSEKTIKLKFSLAKGSYATIVVKMLFG